MNFTARELARIAALMLEKAGDLLQEAPRLPHDRHSKALADVRLLQKGAAAIINLPPDTSR